MTAVALTVAGSDSSGGAGIQADLKTFAAFAVFGTSAITAITAQNTRGVSGVANLDPAFVAAQIDAVADDFTIAAAKTGMLSRTEIIGAVANRIRIRKIPNVVVDPVMVAASGDVLLEPNAITMMREVMLPLATVVTPNLREASILTGCDVSNRVAMREAAQGLVALGARAALVKGGSPAAVAPAGDVHNQDAIDILYDGHNFREFRARPRRRDAPDRSLPLLSRSGLRVPYRILPRLRTWRSQSARPPDDWSIYAPPRRDAQHRDAIASQLLRAPWNCGNRPRGDCASANHARLHAPSADGRVQRLDRGHRGGSASVSARLCGSRDCTRVQGPRRRELELRRVD